MRFEHGPWHGEVRALPYGTKRHIVPAAEGRSVRCYVYVPHPTYPTTVMVLDSEASDGLYPLLTRNPNVMVMDNCGSTTVTLLGEYSGRMFELDDVRKQLDAHYTTHARKPGTIELTAVLTREED